jgi:FtsP/CotA-like multicopper oxidase with cupredoxin domain
MRKVLLPAVALVLLAGLWFWLKPASTAPTETQTRHYTLAFVEGAYQGPEILTAYAGDTVQLEVTSDHDDAMHVHGYEKHLVLPAGETAKLSFIAEDSGRFMLELHGTDLEFGALEVYPRR